MNWREMKQLAEELEELSAACLKEANEEAPSGSVEGQKARFLNGKCSAYDEAARKIRHLKIGFHVGIYEVTREYGGPEEGGWYFDEGILLDSEIVETLQEALDQQHLYRTEYPNDGRNRFSAAPQGVDYEYEISTNPLPKHFPEEKPRYE